MQSPTTTKKFVKTDNRYEVRELSVERNIKIAFSVNSFNIIWLFIQFEFVKYGFIVIVFLLIIFIFRWIFLLITVSHSFLIYLWLCICFTSHQINAKHTKNSLDNCSLNAFFFFFCFFPRWCTQLNTVFYMFVV